MKVTPEFRMKFKQLSADQNGVFTTYDLEIIISPTSKVDLYRQIKKLEREKLITRVRRGLYVSESFSPEQLVMTIAPDSYLSLEYALAYFHLIGSYSDKKVRPIAENLAASIHSKLLAVEFKQISSELIFGIENINGVRIATKEKAILDTLYFYQKGTKFSFDIYSDIDLEDVDTILILKYLKKYKNPKFIKFVEDYLNV